MRAGPRSSEVETKEATELSRRRTPRHVECDLLLVGQPNVGKSVLFSRLTGVRTIVSNYPGTTVSYAAGRTYVNEVVYRVVDAPGTYSLEPLDEAAAVTVDLIDVADRIINVVDATHLERHLTLTLELLAQNKPTAVALNMSDEARHKGIYLDAAALEAELHVPVAAIVARTGEGVKQLVERCLSLPSPRRPAGRPTGLRGHHPHLARTDHRSAASEHIHLDAAEVWQRIGRICEKVQRLEHHHRSVAERLEELSIHPLWGGLFATIVLLAAFGVIRLLGEFFITGDLCIVGEPWLSLPFGSEFLFEHAVKPGLGLLSEALQPGSVLHRVLIGTLVGGQIDFMQSFGILTSGVFIPLGVVLPYLVSFYFVLSLMEDSGYLPRLAIFLDNFMHRLGLHGYAIIPTLLGLGCNVPGIMATRILEGRRQRFVAAALISIAVPCAALQAMIVGLVGRRGVAPVIAVYGILFVVWILISLVLRLISREFRPELLVEIPPYRLPSARALATKLWMRISSFLREAVPVIFGAIIVVNLLYQLQLFDRLAMYAEPIITRFWGLPRDATVPLLVGILRKDVALGMLLPLSLTVKQLIIGSVLLAMFFPCLATFVVLFRELGIKDALKSLGVMAVAVFATGSVLNLVL